MGVCDGRRCMHATRATTYEKAKGDAIAWAFATAEDACSQRGRPPMRRLKGDAIANTAWTFAMADDARTQCGRPPMRRAKGDAIANTAWAFAMADGACTQRGRPPMRKAEGDGNYQAGCSGRIERASGCNYHLEGGCCSGELAIGSSAVMGDFQFRAANGREGCKTKWLASRAQLARCYYEVLDHGIGSRENLLP